MLNLTLYWTNLIIPIVVLIPNLLWLIFPPTNNPSSGEQSEPLFLTFLENIGRIGLTATPLFFPIILDGIVSYFYLTFMLISLFFYYSGWLRFFSSGREYTLLFLPIRHIPIPMAISPILYFILSAGLLKSIPMLIAAILLAIGHLPISYSEYRRITRFIS